MEKILFSIVFAICIIGCFNDEKLKFNTNLVPDQNALDEKARSAFLQKSIVTEFRREGLFIDCEASICAQITDASLKVLQQYKNHFLQKKDRIKYIDLVKEEYPIYSYKSEQAFIPAQLTAEIMNDFFEVLNIIRDFENYIGFRVEFSSSRYLKQSIIPLLQILKDNSPLLKAEAHRIKLLVINSVFNVFSPSKSTVMLTIDDLKKSFTELWTFMSLFYKSQDLFGNVLFILEKENPASIATMNTLFKHSNIFQPLLAKLQNRSIKLFSWDYYYYIDNSSIFMDLGVSNSHDTKYLEEVFKDQIRVMELSEFIGKRIGHTEGVIMLQGHNECLDKIDTIKNSIKEKVYSLKILLITSNQDTPIRNSSFANGKLILNCDQEISEMEVVINQI